MASSTGKLAGAPGSPNSRQERSFALKLVVVTALAIVLDRVCAWAGDVPVAARAPGLRWASSRGPSAVSSEAGWRRRFW